MLLEATGPGSRATQGRRSLAPGGYRAFLLLWRRVSLAAFLIFGMSRPVVLITLFPIRCPLLQSMMMLMVDFEGLPQVRFLLARRAAELYVGAAWRVYLLQFSRMNLQSLRL